MTGKYVTNDIAFLIESNLFIRKVKILKFAGGLYTIQFINGSGGIKVRENRLFSTREEAEAALSKARSKPAPPHPTPWD